MFMLSLHEIESGWASKDTLRLFSKTVKIRNKEFVYQSTRSYMLYRLSVCFQSGQVAFKGFEIISYICNVHSREFQLFLCGLVRWLVMDSSVRRCQRTRFMSERSLLGNNCLFLWNRGGCLVLLRASLSQCQVLRFKQTIQIASVSHLGSRHFSKARWEKRANLLGN